MTGILTVAAPAAVHGQLDTRRMCFEGSTPASVRTIDLPHGFHVELRRDPDSLAYEVACTATVRDAADSSYWSETGFRAAIDGATGEDFDGDGSADAVVAVDVGGGNRCCWTHTILQLRPAFRVLAKLDFPAQYSADSAGHMIVWQTMAFYDLGTAMAFAPYVMKAYRWRDGALRDVTADLCPWILGDRSQAVGNRRYQWEVVTPERQAAAREPADSSDADDIGRTRSAVMSLSLQLLACDQPGEAEAMVEATWPPSEAQPAWQQVRETWIRHNERR